MSRGLSRQRDVIAAISTGSGGGVGMVRLSGPGSLAAAGQVFFPQDRRKKLPELPGYTGAYGQFRRGAGGAVLDDGVAFVYHAPKSYTGEEMAELCCHGGAFVMEQVLELCLQKGARLAEPGEFTKRAFLNGRMDLSRAEAVMDVIGAQNEYALGASVGQLKGKLF